MFNYFAWSACLNCLGTLFIRRSCGPRSLVYPSRRSQLHRTARRTYLTRGLRSDHTACFYSHRRSARGSAVRQTELVSGQMWWTRREQSYRTVAYLIANSIASIIGPILAYGIGHATQQHPRLPGSLPLPRSYINRDPAIGLVHVAKLACYSQVSKPRQRQADSCGKAARKQHRYQGEQDLTWTEFADLGRRQSGNGTSSGRRCVT
jgi:hypothetical protein